MPARRSKERIASLLFLAVGWAALVATSSPAPNDHLDTTLSIRQGHEGRGPGELLVLANTGAAASSTPHEQLKVVVSANIPMAKGARTTPPSSVVTPDGQVLAFIRMPDAIDGFRSFGLTWYPQTCTTACIRTTRLAPGNAAGLPPGTRWDLTASIGYHPGEDSAPADAGIAVGLRRRGDVALVTSNTGPRGEPSAVLLTSDQPRVHQTVRFRFDPTTLPEGSTVDLVWAGGAMRALLADSGTRATVILTPHGRESVAATASDELEMFDGARTLRFELPLTVTCDPDGCSADVEVDLALEGGAWTLLDWSNNVPGIVLDGTDTAVYGWDLQVVETSELTT